MTLNKRIENTQIFKTIFTIQVLSQKVNKLPITSINLCYIVTKKPLHQWRIH